VNNTSLQEQAIASKVRKIWWFLTADLYEFRQF